MFPGKHLHQAASGLLFSAGIRNDLSPNWINLAISIFALKKYRAWFNPEAIYLTAFSLLFVHQPSLRERPNQVE